MDSDRPDEEKSKMRITHSEVEKRRREKMNKYLFDLMPYLPINEKDNNGAKKIDKITILRMAVQHMKYLKNSNSLLNDSLIRKKIISDAELHGLMFSESDGFLLALKCDNCKVVYASKSSVDCIGYSPKELIGKIFFELTHQFDNKYVKDQLNFTELMNNRSSLNNYQLEKPLMKITGNRRSFVCRILFNTHAQRNNNHSSYISDNDYQVVQFTGYIKYEPYLLNLLESTSNTESNSSKDLPDNSLSKSGKNVMNSRSELSDAASEAQNSTNNLTLDKNKYFLILYGQLANKKASQQFEFIMKSEFDSKILYIDPQCYLVIGYLAHELVTNPFVEYVHPDDVEVVKKCAIEAIKKKKKVVSEPYRFKMKNGEYIFLESTIFILDNPFTHQIEYFISKIRPLQIPTTPKSMSSQYSPSSYSPCPSSVLPSTSSQSDMNIDSINNPNTPSQSQANEFMRALVNNNYDINEYSDSPSIPMTPMEQMMRRGSNNNDSNDMLYSQRYNWMS